MQYVSYLILFFFIYSVIHCEQPYFPQQIVFSVYNDQALYAIDEINQRAYSVLMHGASGNETGFVLQHFPYAIPDSPESKNYVQLLLDSTRSTCRYGVYWQYGLINFNQFPIHWVNSESSFQVKSYIQFKYKMINGNDSSEDEDYWYTNEKCQIDSGEVYPCNEIYFKKNTDIPLRSTEVVRLGFITVRNIYNYQVISIGKPDDKYFDLIPTNWSIACLDVSLDVLYLPQTTKINVNHHEKIRVWLYTPPHRINGSDTVTIQWKANQFNDSLTWTPNELTFNSENFQKEQILTVTRVKDSPRITLTPIFNGGGFDFVLPSGYPIYIE